MRADTIDSRSARFVAAVLLGLVLWCAPGRPAAQAGLEQREIHLPGPGGDEVVWVGYPRGASGELPIVVALHGAGEARRGRGRGHLGWSHDYALPLAFEALLRGRLTTADYGEFVRPEHLREHNRALAERAFRGLVVVTPYTPNLLSEPVGSDAIRAYGDWVAGPLLDAVRAEVGVASRTRAGIDGVSLGGRMALEVGLRHPDRFASVGAIQPAIRGHVDEVAALASTPRQALRLLSSDDDPFLRATRALSAAWGAAGIAHEMVVTPGPHDYAFNRGPGSIELLYFADRSL